MSAAGVPVTVVELGSGTAEKTRTLLRELEKKQMLVPYFPVDISRAAVEEARERVESQCPKTRVRPVVADFSQGFGFLRDIPGRKLVLYLGSSIGNYDRDDAVEMLDEVREELNDGDKLLIGTDMVKAPAVLLSAYDDAQGVTAEFNKNILRRINLELGGNFNLDSFRHIALWNSRQSRIEMHLESMRQQTVEIELLGLGIKLAAGERIHTENSYKYTIPMVDDMLASAGFTPEKTWKDSRDWFALHLASR
ncbi:MAG: L-histidine N(alpha)-methyltransferase [Acidobacteriales bacterium]|nr:L-histidine N(alpha)-methyltransferase [Terriglobales bacterium]